ncbi:MAG: PIN domain-containing protein [Thermodesulfobacteriota bacterium]
MNLLFGIDTSVIVRLVTGDPEDIFLRCVNELTALVEKDGAEIYASNQVIGEAYIALQHHYGVSKPEARTGLKTVLRSGLVAPMNGRSVFEALDALEGCGLLDRLIADEYSRKGLETLTLDRKMAALPNARRL